METRVCLGKGARKALCAALFECFINAWSNLITNKSLDEDVPSFRPPSRPHLSRSFYEYCVARWLRANWKWWWQRGSRQRKRRQVSRVTVSRIVNLDARRKSPKLTDDRKSITWREGAREEFTLCSVFVNKFLTVSRNLVIRVSLV